MITEEEIKKISASTPGQLEDGFCRTLVYFLIGYLSNPVNEHDSLESVRQHFYGQIKQHLERQKHTHEADVSGRKEKGQAG